MLLHALTIFCGAFLLFLVQPLIGKYILPWFGGSPGVWSTCLLFFQTLLLGGYAYAHALSTWLKPRRQAWVHLALLALAVATLPIAPGPEWKPLTGDAPTGRILLLLTVCLGLPYLALSATGPLVQRWFSLGPPGVSPYRLFALSNAGSLLALAAYPFAVEPLLSRAAQSRAWSAGMVLFALLCGACAWRARKLPAGDDGGPVSGRAADSGDAEIAPPTRTADAYAGAVPPTAMVVFFWIALPAVASLLLVAVTNKLSTDVAVIPFLWVLPLGLYLLTFILCFDHPRWYARTLFSALLAAGCGTVWFLLDQGPSAKLPLQVAGYTGTLFAACMVCHGEVHRLKPAPRRLTGFYLCLAAGGALGGVLVAVVAPRVFPDFHELPLGLWALAYFTGVLSLVRRSRELAAGSAAGVLALMLLIPAMQTKGADGLLDWLRLFPGHVRAFNGEWWIEELCVAALLFACLHEGWRPVGREWQRRMSVYPLVMSILLGVVFIVQATATSRTAVERVRNFYGTLKVRSYNAGAPTHYHLFSHGLTTHGLQFTERPRSLQPTTYYGPTSGVGRIIDLLPGSPGRHVGMVGLGAGSIAAYGLPGDRFRIYEINPGVIRLARERFTYLADSAADISVVPGDARLTLEAELRHGERQRFDLLVLDAFSSDAIPVHLLTSEAFTLYLAHMKPAGVIAVHVSNRHLDLRPVVEAQARQHALHFATIEDDPLEEDWWLYGTTWILLGREEHTLASAEIQDAADPPPDGTARSVLWTDDFASLLDVLK